MEETFGEMVAIILVDVIIILITGIIVEMTMDVRIVLFNQEDFSREIALVDVSQSQSSCVNGDAIMAFPFNKRGKKWIM